MFFLFNFANSNCCHWFVRFLWENFVSLVCHLTFKLSNFNCLSKIVVILIVSSNAILQLFWQDDVFYNIFLNFKFDCCKKQLFSDEILWNSDEIINSSLCLFTSTVVVVVYFRYLNFALNYRSFFSENSWLIVMISLVDD